MHLHTQVLRYLHNVYVHSFSYTVSTYVEPQTHISFTRLEDTVVAFSK